jgi:chaperonin GroES
VLEIEEPEDETEGGIVLPDTAKEKPQRGEVVAAGPGKLLDSGERKSLSVEEGDTVIFGNYAGTDVEFDGKEYKIVKEDEIQAKLEV